MRCRLREVVSLLCGIAVLGWSPSPTAQGDGAGLAPVHSGHSGHSGESAELATVMDGAEGPGADATQPSAAAHLRFLRETAEVGEPVELVVDVAHDPREPFLWGRFQPEPDASWVLFDSRPDWSTTDDEGRSVSRRVYRLASLEPGPRRAPDAFREALEDLGAVLYGLEPLLEVRGVLAEGEDAPRPMRGYPEGFDVDGETQAEGTLLERLLWPCLALVAAVAAFLLWRRRKPAPAPHSAPSPRKRLAALREGESDLAERVFAASHIVRAAADQTLGAGRPGLTDAEWLASVRGDVRLDGDLRGELDALFARFEEIKYAGRRPSKWALEETFETAQRVVGGLEAPGAAQGPHAAQTHARDAEAVS